jgi:hypothetical protein
VRALVQGCEGDDGAQDRKQRGRKGLRPRVAMNGSHGRGDARMGLTPGENGGEGVSTRRKVRRSCAQGESGNGGAVEEHDAGG